MVINLNDILFTIKTGIYIKIKNMLLNLKSLLFILFVGISINSVAQVANDDCGNAAPLGNLPTPANCGNGPNNNGQGAPAVFTNLTNVLARSRSSSKANKKASLRMIKEDL